MQIFFSPESQFPFSRPILSDGNTKDKKFPYTAVPALVRHPSFFCSPFSSSSSLTEGPAKKRTDWWKGVCVLGEVWQGRSDSCVWPMAVCGPNLEGMFLLVLAPDHFPLTVLCLLWALISPFPPRPLRLPLQRCPLAQHFHTSFLNQWKALCSVRRC